MHEIDLTGGAKIGWAHARYPFANLTVNKNKLELNASILGNLAFKPSDVISIIPTNVTFQSGIQINHRVNSYNSTVVFITSNPRSLILEILETGFLSNEGPIPVDIENQINEMQAGGSFPVKVPVAVALIVIWNILFAVNYYKFSTSGNPIFLINVWAQSALLLVTLFCFLLIIVKPFRPYVLKPGHNFRHISKFIWFIMFICGFMLIGTLFLNSK